MKSMFSTSQNTKKIPKFNFGIFFIYLKFYRPLFLIEMDVYCTS